MKIINDYFFDFANGSVFLINKSRMTAKCTNLVKFQENP